MRKKFFLLLLITVLFSWTQTTFASGRWVCVQNSNSIYSFWLDTATIRLYNDNKKNLYTDCWTKTILENRTIIEHTYIQTTENLNYMIAESFVYDKNGKLLDEQNKKEEGWKTPIPDSNFEHDLANIILWVATNFDSIKKD